MNDIKDPKIAVNVEVFFLTKQSRDEDEFYIWAYKVNIENKRSGIIKLKEKKWFVADSLGNAKEIKSRVFVGEQSTVNSGETYEYISGIPLIGQSGMMVGSYVVETENGDIIDVAVPAFSLDSPCQELPAN